MKSRLKIYPVFDKKVNIICLCLSDMFMFCPDHVSSRWEMQGMPVTVLRWFLWASLALNAGIKAFSLWPEALCIRKNCSNVKEWPFEQTSERYYSQAQGPGKYNKYAFIIQPSDWSVIFRFASRVQLHTDCFWIRHRCPRSDVQANGGQHTRHLSTSSVAVFIKNIDFWRLKMNADPYADDTARPVWEHVKL